MSDIKIVVVDDMECNTNLFVDYIKKNFPNAKVVGFTSPVDACAKIIQEADFDIVIMDNIMPAMDGVEVAERIVQEYRPYIILLSVAADKFKKQHDELFDYKINKGNDMFNNLKITITEIINFIESGEVREQIESILPQSVEPKNKLFLKDVLLCVLLNRDSRKVYEPLVDTLDRSEGWIRKKISKILSTAYQDFGFNKKPTNVEFLEAIKERIDDTTEQRRKAGNE